MTIEERADKAAELKASGKCNCTQSVLKVFEDVLPIDDETQMKMSSGYAAGMGGMESTCGALIGAVMVVGILSDGKATAGLSKKMVTDFKEHCGATICKDLKGLDTGKVLCECPDCVRNAVLALGRVMEKKVEENAKAPAELTDRKIYDTDIGPVCMSKTEHDAYVDAKEVRNG